MAVTQLADVIVPEVFNPYVIQRTAELSAFWTSGIVGPVADVAVPKGGSLVQMPFWQDLAGDDQVLDSTTNLTVAKFTTGKDIAIVNGRALVYGSTDLAAALAGSDPMTAVGDLMAAKWARQMQKVAINVLNGAMAAMAAESGSPNVLDISALTGGAEIIDGDSLIDAGGELGDAESQLTAMAIHSATERVLRKQDLIDYLPDSEGKPTIATYQGKRVIVDDGLPAAGGTYTTYLFGAGALGYAEGTPKVPSEIQREALVNGGEEYIVSRRHFILHPRGIKFDGTIAADTPTNTELGTVGNWTPVYEAKNIRIVQFKHKIA